MKRKKNSFIVTMIILVVLVILAITISIAIGQYSISIKNVILAIISIVFDTDLGVDLTVINIIKLIRLPRTMAAFIVGSSLAVSGCIYQNTFNNQLVSPDVLGVSSGACVGAAIAIIIGFNSYGIGVFAFIFGLLSVAIATLLPRFFKSRKTITLILSGIIVGSFMNSIIGFIKFVADREDKLAEITFWIMGSLTGIENSEILLILPIYILAIIGVILLRWKINIISLGEEDAKSLGLNYRRIRLFAIILSTVLTAISVSISGNIGWIGLVIPHISRAIIGNDNRYVIPITILLGGGFLIIIDFIARNVSINEVPLSILTGLIGTVIYSCVLLKKGKMIHE